MLALPPSPRLHLTHAAQAKMLWLANAFDVEVAAFGVTSPPHPNLVHDFILLPQRSSAGGVTFKDSAILDYTERLGDVGANFNYFLRVWAHTHPSDSASPSYTDEINFAELMRRFPYIAMLIFGKSGDMTCTLGQRNPDAILANGAFGRCSMTARVDHAASCTIPEDAIQRWTNEFEKNVEIEKAVVVSPRRDSINAIAHGDRRHLAAPNFQSLIASPDPIHLGDDDPDVATEIPSLYHSRVKARRTVHPID